MRVLIAAGIYPPDIGGPATYVKELEEKLPENGIDVKVVTYSDSETRFDDNNSDIYRVDRRNSLLVRYFQYTKAVYNLAKDCDLIYVQGPGGPALPSWIASRLRGIPYAMKVVGDYAWEQSRQKLGVKDLLDEFQNKTYGLLVEFRRKVQEFVTKGAKNIIVPSNYLKNIVSGWGVREDKIDVIYNDVEVEDIDENRSSLREKIGLDKFSLLCVARFVPWKGLYSLIDSVSELKEEGLELELNIIGDGTLFEDVKEYSEENDLGDIVNFLGRKPHKEVLEYMKASDAFILNTSYEGLPHVIIEAMYYKLPVLTTPAGGNTELVEDKNTGLLFGYKNKEEIKEVINKVYNDSDLREELGESAHDFIKELEQKDMIDTLTSKLKQYESS